MIQFGRASNRSSVALTALVVCAIASLGLFLEGDAASKTQSVWTDQTNSKVRLVGDAVPEAGAPSFYAGVQLRMDKGWKTYWRNPGDSGVPPSFDWSGSKNVEAVEVLYPAPHRFSDANGTAIGYSGEVVFPLRITPKRVGDPVTLSLDFDYGLCKDLCIPNAVHLNTVFEPGGGKSDGRLLEAALSRVPKKAQDDHLPRVMKISGGLDGDAPELKIEVEFPEGATGTDVFVDNPKALVPVTKALGPLEDGRQRFAIAFPVIEEAAALKGKPLTITVVAEDGASETTWTAP